MDNLVVIKVRCSLVNRELLFISVAYRFNYSAQVIFGLTWSTLTEPNQVYETKITHVLNMIFFISYILNYHIFNWRNCCELNVTEKYNFFYTHF
jgi:hypothetical protein